MLRVSASHAQPCYFLFTNEELRKLARDVIDTVVTHAGLDDDFFFILFFMPRVNADSNKNVHINADSHTFSYPCIKSCLKH